MSGSTVPLPGEVERLAVRPSAMSSRAAADPQSSVTCFALFVIRHILEQYGVDADVIDHVCRIVANHHSAREIDTPEFRVVWDADWLVNIPDEFDVNDTTKIERLVSRVFKTEGGKRIARAELLPVG